MEKQKIFVGIRNVDEELFRKFRAWAIQKRLNLNDALNNLIKESLKEDELKLKKEKLKDDAFKRLLALKPIKIGNKKVRWSEEVDEIVYGIKK